MAEPYKILKLWNLLWIKLWETISAIYIIPILILPGSGIRAEVLHPRQENPPPSTNWITIPKLILPGSGIRAEVLHPRQENPPPLPIGQHVKMHPKKIQQEIYGNACNSARLWLAFAWTKFIASLAICHHEWNFKKRHISWIMGSNFHEVDWL